MILLIWVFIGFYMAAIGYFSGDPCPMLEYWSNWLTEPLSYSALERLLSSRIVAPWVGVKTDPVLTSFEAGLVF